jgi:hypothetical protein
VGASNPVEITNCGRGLWGRGRQGSAAHRRVPSMGMGHVRRRCHRRSGCAIPRRLTVFKARVPTAVKLTFLASAFVRRNSRACPKRLPRGSLASRVPVERCGQHRRPRNFERGRHARPKRVQRRASDRGRAAMAEAPDGAAGDDGALSQACSAASPCPAPPRQAPPPPPSARLFDTTPVSIMRATPGAAELRASFSQYETGAQSPAPPPPQFRPPAARRRFAVEPAGPPLSPRPLVPAARQFCAAPTLHRGAQPLPPRRRHFFAHEPQPPPDAEPGAWRPRGVSAPRGTAAAVRRKLFAVAAPQAGCGGRPSFAVPGPLASSPPPPAKRARVDRGAFLIAGDVARTQPEVGAPGATTAARRSAGPLQLALRAVAIGARKRMATLLREPQDGGGPDAADAVRDARRQSLIFCVEGRGGGGALIVGTVVADAEDGSVLAGDRVAVRSVAEEEVLEVGAVALAPAPWTALRGTSAGGAFELGRNVDTVVLATVVAPVPAHLLEAVSRATSVNSPPARRLRRPAAELPPREKVSALAVAEHSTFSSIAPHEQRVKLVACVLGSSAEAGVAVVEDALGQLGLLTAACPPRRRDPAAAVELGEWNVAVEGVPLSAVQRLLVDLCPSRDAAGSGAEHDGRRCRVPVFT